MVDINFIQVDESSTITCLDLEGLAEKVNILVGGNCSKEFNETLWSLKMNLLQVSKMIKENRALK